MQRKILNCSNVNVLEFQVYIIFNPQIIIQYIDNIIQIKLNLFDEKGSLLIIQIQKVTSLTLQKSLTYGWVEFFMLKNFTFEIN